MAITAHDIVSDSPTNNFCTLNPLNVSILNSSPDFKEGNLYLGYLGSSNSGHVAPSTIRLPDTGKWYFEGTKVGGTYYSFGIVGEDNATKTRAINQANASSGIIGVLVDCDTNTIYGYVNNTLTTTNSITSEERYFYAQCWSLSGSGRGQVVVNFGQDPTFGGNKNTPATVNGVTGPFAPSGAAAGTAGLFYYPPPAGALALCTANLPEMTPTVTGDTPQDYFKAVEYPGDGDNTREVTGVGFQPDFIWIKRTNTTGYHVLFDSVRGATNWLYSNNTGTEDNDTFTNDAAFIADGFKPDDAGSTNADGSTYVAMCWKAGGPPDLTSSPTKPFAKNGVQYETLSAANITAGTITPTAMSVNTDAGFSIVSYTGNATAGVTVGHGLISAPDMIIVKSRTEAVGWYVYHSSNTSAPETDFLRLDEDIATVDNIGPWDDTAPSSTVFTLGDGGSTNRNTEDYIAYCWHSVEGYSKFGSYTGNGSADGTFVYCGFRPAFLIIKNSDRSGSHWLLYDNQRSNYNVINKILFPSSSAEENGEGTLNRDNVDFLSNGFKLRGDPAGAWSNASNEKLIYMAFSEQSFKFSNAR